MCFLFVYTKKKQYLCSRISTVSSKYYLLKKNI